jgi:hypothetical protein
MDSQTMCSDSCHDSPLVVIFMNQVQNSLDVDLDAYRAYDIICAKEKALGYMSRVRLFQSRRVGVIEFIIITRILLCTGSHFHTRSHLRSRKEFPHQHLYRALQWLY